jgi:hypothetical protein
MGHSTTAITEKHYVRLPPGLLSDERAQPAGGGLWVRVKPTAIEIAIKAVPVKARKRGKRA